MDRLCIICGKALPPRRTRYCSPECAREGANRLAREVTSKRPKSTPWRTIICPDCGREVRVHIKSKRCPECQAEADRRHNLECQQRRRLGKTRPIGSTDICQRCGKPYTVWSGLQKYCEECREEACREVDHAMSRDWNRRARATDPTYAQRTAEGKRRPAPEPRQCAVCGKTFTPSSLRVICCSPECTKARHAQMTDEYVTGHRERVNQQIRDRRKAATAAMTPDELTAWREQVNAKARENYKKRQERKKEE